MSWGDKTVLLIFRYYRSWLRDAFRLDLHMDLCWIIYMLFDLLSFSSALIMITWISLLSDILISVSMKALLSNNIVECLVGTCLLHKKWSFPLRIFFSKCDQIRRKVRIFSHLLKKSLMENLIFCAVIVIFLLLLLVFYVWSF